MNWVCLKVGEKWEEMGFRGVGVQVLKNNA